jgi:hypothetical protein
VGEGPEGSDKPELRHESAHGRALAAGDNKPVKAGKVGLQSHFHYLGPKSPQHPGVFSERPL